MTDPDRDYLWDPSEPGDPQIEALERVLRRHGAHARGLLNRPPVLAPLRRRRRRWLRGYWLRIPAGLAATVAVLILIAHHYRLSWPEGAPWDVSISQQGEAPTQLDLRPGETLTTSPAQTARLEVARIGKVALASSSSVRLLRTGEGRHRIAMEAGRLHAKIWAPPGHFGVVSGDAVFIDLGCEFELDVAPSGAGTLAVLSGWVAYEHGAREVLVPAGHRLMFDRAGSGTPVSDRTAPQVRDAIRALDAALRAGDKQATERWAEALAVDASNSDYHSLLSLLTRHPPLAGTPLYSRLGHVLGRDSDGPLHRAQWTRGDAAAIDLWWERVPMPPKQWLLNWRDAF